MRNSLKHKYSAAFKRDYVAAAAVVIFLSIVLAEIFLAVYLPLYVKKESSIAVSVRRLRLIESFDNLRNTVNHVNSKDENVQAEVNLLLWNLNLLADYLRKWSDHLTSREIELLQNQINEMLAVANHLLHSGRPFTREQKLDYAHYLEQVMKKSGVYNER